MYPADKEISEYDYLKFLGESIEKIKTDYVEHIENKEIVIALNACGANVGFVEINSDKGHDSFLLDVPEFLKTISEFIDLNSSKSKSKFLRWVMDYKWYDAQRVHTGLFNVFGMRKTNPTRHKRMFPLFISGIIFTRFIIFLSCGGLIIYGYCVFFCDI